MSFVQEANLLKFVVGEGEASRSSVASRLTVPLPVSMVGVGWISLESVGERALYNQGCFISGKISP